MGVYDALQDFYALDTDPAVEIRAVPVQLPPPLNLLTSGALIACELKQKRAGRRSAAAQQHIYVYWPQYTVLACASSNWQAAALDRALRAMRRDKKVADLLLRGRSALRLLSSIGGSSSLARSALFISVATAKELSKRARCSSSVCTTLDAVVSSWQASASAKAISPVRRAVGVLQGLQKWAQQTKRAMADSSRSGRVTTKRTARTASAVQLSKAERQQRAADRHTAAVAKRTQKAAAAQARASARLARLREETAAKERRAAAQAARAAAKAAVRLRSHGERGRPKRQYSADEQAERRRRDSLAVQIAAVRCRIDMMVEPRKQQLGVPVLWDKLYRTVHRRVMPYGIRMEHLNVQQLEAELERLQRLSLQVQTAVDLGHDAAMDELYNSVLQSDSTAAVPVQQAVAVDSLFAMQLDGDAGGGGAAAAVQPAGPGSAAGQAAAAPVLPQQAAVPAAMAAAVVVTGAKRTAAGPFGGLSAAALLYCYPSGTRFEAEIPEHEPLTAQQQRSEYALRVSAQDTSWSLTSEIAAARQAFTSHRRLIPKGGRGPVKVNTFDKDHLRTFLGFGGYVVEYLEVPRSLFTLLMLTNQAMVMGFVSFLMERGVTPHHIHVQLGHVMRALHWIKDVDAGGDDKKVNTLTRHTAITSHRLSPHLITSHHIST